MSGLIVPQVPFGLSNDEIAELVAKALKEIDWAFNGNISDQNISRIANFLASATELKHISGIVGMSGFDPGNPGAVRFWSGHADKLLAIFRVLQNGHLFASDVDITGVITALSGLIANWVIEGNKIHDENDTVGLDSTETVDDDIRIYAGNDGDPALALFRVTKSGLVYCGGLTSEGGIITGGLIRTAASGARVELTGGVLKGYSADDNLHGLVFSPTPVSNFFDLFLYHEGSKLLEFIDNATSVTIKGSSGSTGMILGGSTAPTFGAGEWVFPGHATFDNDVGGKISEAYSADHATTASSADELSPSGEISWAQVLKGGSDIADLSAKNLSSLTQNSSYRTVTDAEKSTWNAKWGDTTLTSRSAFSAYHSSSQSITLNTWTKINYQTEEYDHLSEYSTSTYRFTAAAAGIYAVTGSVTMQINDGSRFILKVYKNGAAAKMLEQLTTGSTDYITALGTTQIKLAASDYVEIYVYVQQNVTTVAATEECYFTMTRIA